MPERTEWLWSDERISKKKHIWDHLAEASQFVSRWDCAECGDWDSGASQRVWGLLMLSVNLKTEDGRNPKIKSREAFWAPAFGASHVIQPVSGTWEYGSLRTGTPQRILGVVGGE